VAQICASESSAFEPPSGAFLSLVVAQF